MTTPDPRRFSRRTALKWAAGAAAVPAVAGTAAYSTRESRGPTAARSLAQNVPFPELEEVTVAELRAALDGRRLSARELVDMHLDRITAIDHGGPALNAIMEVNPDAQAIADRLDAELQRGASRGPLHGIPCCSRTISTPPTTC